MSYEILVRSLYGLEQDRQPAVPLRCDRTKKYAVLYSDLKETTPNWRILTEVETLRVPMFSYQASDESTIAGFAAGVDLGFAAMALAQLTLDMPKRTPILLIGDRAVKRGATDYLHFLGLVVRQDN